MSILRRALSWVAGLIMIVAYALVLLAIWPFVRRTEAELKDDANNDN
jgi:hypothetical protein